MNAVTEMQQLHGISPLMKHRNALGIRGKLMIGFFSITLIFLIAIGITLHAINITKQYSEQVVTVELPTFDALIDLQSLLFQSQMAIQSIVLSPNTTNQTDLTPIWDTIDKVQSSIDDYSKEWKQNSNIQQWQTTKNLLGDLKSAQFKVATATDKTQALSLLETTVMPLIHKVANQLNIINTSNITANSLLDNHSKQLHAGTDEIMQSLTTIQMAEYILSVIGILASIVIALLTARAIIRHINIFRQLSSKIASGDLTQSITIESIDEIGQLGHDLNTMTISLATMTKEIIQACHNMVSTLDEVRQSVDVQSSGASEQASSINEITASLSEIEKSSAQTMLKAKTMGEAAERTCEKGKMGLEAVDQSINGMKEIGDKVRLIAQTILDLSNKTQQVGEITAAVNNLAQQSKMLALNASIEAAKAGEAGKGFAVVAIEVKTLAEQSEQATTQVQKILEDIKHAADKAVMVTEEGTKGVAHGTTLVEQTGDIIRNLNDVIYETTIATQQIESAIRQEAAGIEQITAGMNEINQVTATFVESVNQTTEAMRNLAAISKNLQAHVDSYKIK
jgi:methyl-accepting chemotaxis protein